MNIIFTNAKKFNLDEPDGKQFHWHDLWKKPELFFERVKECK